MSKLQDKERAIALAKSILQLAEKESEAKKEKDKLKAELTTICDQNFGGFFDKDGKWELTEEGIKIQTALNPPKGIFTESGLALEPKDRQKIALTLEDKYVVLDVDFKTIQNKLEFDKNLKKALNAAGVEIKQEVRYDVKKLK